MINKDSEKRHFDLIVGGAKEKVFFYDSPFLKKILHDLESSAYQWLELSGAEKVLVYGGGINLAPAMDFLEQGALCVYMIDISPKSVEILKEKISRLGLKEKIVPMVMDCENLEFSDHFFDRIYGRAILHHLDINKALLELHRVLTEDGLSVFIEPLGMNPLINLYRKFTPQRRTPDEKPFDKKDFKLFEEAEFSRFEHHEYTLFTGLGIFFHTMLKMPETSFTRYELLKRIDDIVLSQKTILNRFCWNTLMRFIK